MSKSTSVGSMVRRSEFEDFMFAAKHMWVCSVFRRSVKKTVFEKRVPESCGVGAGLWDGTWGETGVAMEADIGAGTGARTGAGAGAGAEAKM